MSAHLRAIFETGIKTLGLTATEQQIEKSLTFINLLAEWNQAFNLTAIKNKEEMVSRHLLDSLAIAPYLHGQHILDVGTGAGLPGIPLAIFFPQKQFYLLDSNQKRQVFVVQATNKIGLKNTLPVTSLVEKYQPGQKFSTIVARAFAPLERMLPQVAPLLADQGRLLAMLGKVDAPLGLNEGWKLCDLIELNIPGESAKRHLAILEKGNCA